MKEAIITFLVIQLIFTTLALKDCRETLLVTKNLNTIVKSNNHEN